MKKLALVLLLFLAGESYSQWESMNNGLYGGTVNALISVDGAVLATTKGAIYRSTDNGKNWTRTKVAHSSVSDFLKFGNSIFATTDKTLFVSSDNGLTWESRTTPGNFLTCLTSLNDALYAGDWGEGVFRSEDGGLTWTQKNNGLNEKSVGKLINIGDVLLAGTSKGVYRSTDGGTSWNFASTGLGSSLYINDFDYSNGKVFAGVGIGYLVSADSGATWERKKILNSGKGIDQITSKDGNLYACNSEGIFLSKNGGETWSQQSSEFYEIAYSMIFHGDNLIVGGPVYGVSISGDGGVTLEVMNNGITSMDVRDVDFNDDAMMISTGQAFYSSDGGMNWNRSNSGPSYIQAIDVFHNNFYAVTFDNGVYTSKDNGVTWAENNSGIDKLMMLTLAKNSDTLYAGGDALYRTTDGVNWTKLGFNNNPSSILPINDKIYAATWTGGEIYVSTDGGSNWLLKDNGINGFALVISSLGEYIIAGSNEGIFVSSNGGDNWIMRNEGLTNVRITTLEKVDNTLFAGTVGGLFISSDAGLTWLNKTGDLPDSMISSIKVNNQFVYVGTSDNGLYRAKLSDLGIKGVEDTVVGSKLKLFPNPASEYLTIELPEGSAAAEKIIISDLLGNVVLETQRSGANQQRIDISRLLPGAYSITCGEKRAAFMVVR